MEFNPDICFHPTYNPPSKMQFIRDLYKAGSSRRDDQSPQRGAPASRPVISFEFFRPKRTKAN